MFKNTDHSLKTDTYLKAWFRDDQGTRPKGILGKIRWTKDIFKKNYFWRKAPARLKNQKPILMVVLIHTLWPIPALTLQFLSRGSYAKPSLSRDLWLTVQLRVSTRLYALNFFIVFKKGDIKKKWKEFPWKSKDSFRWIAHRIYE